MEMVADLFRNNYLSVLRFIFPAIGLLIYLLFRGSLLSQPRGGRVLAVLDIENGAVRLPVLHYENTIGRAKSCDVVIPLPVISRQHAVLSLGNNGFWRIADTKSKGGVLVNDAASQNSCDISLGDSLSLAGLKMTLLPPHGKEVRDLVAEHERKGQRAKQTAGRYAAGTVRGGFLNASLILLGIFQVLACCQLFMTLPREHYFALFICFGLMIILPWMYRIYAILTHLRNISVEIMAFFLSTIGMCVTASAAPQELIKQTAAMVAGVISFIIMTRVLKNLRLTMMLRKWAAIASIALLGMTMVLGSTFNGQLNWIDLKIITVQPSEFVKILFVFCGSATLEWLLTTRNLAMLTAYSSLCIGLLFIMGDFGTALIFFVAYLVLIFMTSGDVRMVFLSCLAAVLGAIMIVGYKPYIMNRFSTWGNAWNEMYDAGYQQARTLMAIASGGLFGLGGGNGFLKRVTAADTDMVFGMVCEEWGLFIGLLIISGYVLLLRSAIRSHRSASSSFYVIAACAAASIFLFQAALNIFGSTDILPFTGVTLPFISRGGSSLMASWGLLSFISAALNNRRDLSS